MRQEEAEDYGDRVRKLKSEGFVVEERVAQIQKVKDGKVRDREGLEQELMRV